MASIPLLEVRQWLPEWDSYDYDPKLRQSKPRPYFFIGSISVALIRRLSGVQEREAKGPRFAETGIERFHDKGRSDEISRFVEGGYPWSTLGVRNRGQFDNLKKPGWLPTAIIANVLGSGAKRRGVSLDDRDRLTLTRRAGTGQLVLPSGADRATWRPKGKLHPIEIIDGQHRIYAFNEDDPRGADFFLPVVLFPDLDISWQAYLFWTVNITPKKIDQSFAYDLFPLLRTEAWLERVDGPKTYRETRAQELTEALWSHPESPWRERISMLRRERGKVSQAAFVRSLTLSYVRPWDARSGAPGGLYGTALGADPTDLLRWTRPQQAAYLIFLWRSIADEIAKRSLPWAKDLRGRSRPSEQDPAFAGEFSLLATDQGVRGVLQATNDLSFVLASEVMLNDWSGMASAATDIEAVSKSLQQLRRHKTIGTFVQRLAALVATFDWRLAGTPGLKPSERAAQALFRGGTGYREVRLQLLDHVARSKDRQLAAAAKQVAEALGY